MGSGSQSSALASATTAGELVRHGHFPLNYSTESVRQSGPPRDGVHFRVCTRPWPRLNIAACNLTRDGWCTSSSVTVVTCRRTGFSAPRAARRPRRGTQASGKDHQMPKEPLCPRRPVGGKSMKSSGKVIAVAGGGAGAWPMSGSTRAGPYTPRLAKTSRVWAHRVRDVARIAPP